MRGDPPASLEALVAHHKGAYYATVVLKRRLAALGPEYRPALREIGRYQALVKRYWDALAATQELHERDRAR
jgi:hypothetical protein